MQRIDAKLILFKGAYMQGIEMPTTRPKSLIEILTGQREKILELWMKRVESDERIPSADELNRFVLRDDIPEIIKKISLSMAKHISGIQNFEDAAGTAAYSNAATEHLESRLVHGYQLPEALREFSHLREAILDVRFDSGAKPSLEELQLLHAAIDEIMINTATKILAKNLAEIAETCRT
jgi:hypothetical protein